MITAYSAGWDEGLQVKYKPVQVASCQYYRQPHDKEIVNYNADNEFVGRVYGGPGYRSGPVRERAATATIPEVYWMFPDHGTPLESRWVDFVCRINTPIPRDRAELICSDPHWGFNNQKDRAGFDKPRLCGGALVSGTVDGANLLIDGLLTSDPCPDVDWFLTQRHLWFYGTQINSKGVVTYMTLGLGDGERVPIRVPVLSRLPLYAPVRWFHRMPAGFDVTTYDPRQMY